MGTATARGIGDASALVAREANTLAYIDGFWLCFWIAMVALFCVALITRAPRGHLPGAVWFCEKCAEEVRRGGVVEGMGVD